MLRRFHPSCHWRSLLLYVGVSLFLGSCGSEEKSDIAVREAVREHLAGRTDLALSKMTVELDRVEYDGPSATADVTIAARDDPRASMKMSYRLRRSGADWVVEAPAPGASSGEHAGGVTPGLPPGHPPTGENPAAGGGTLPPGHPPLEGGSGAPTLPKGHPPVAQ